MRLLCAFFSLFVIASFDLDVSTTLISPISENDFFFVDSNTTVVLISAESGTWARANFELMSLRVVAWIEISTSIEDRVDAQTRGKGRRAKF